jgi:hypothetical protein
MSDAVHQLQQDHPCRDSIEIGIRRRIRDCPYSLCLSKVSCKVDGKHVILEGTVSSFYLKQVLQSLVRSMEHVEQISNRVDVVSLVLDEL